MKNEIIRITEERTHEGAERRFVSTCGIDPAGSRKHQRMMEQGLMTRESGISGIDIRAGLRFYGPEHFRDGTVEAEGARLRCNFFSRIPEEYVEGIYIYMLTAGECLFESEDKIMEFLFADIWGNSYVDAGIEALKEDWVIPDMRSRFGGREVFLSEEFGPGYFGMPVRQTVQFAGIMDTEALGISVRESGLMIPQKSCAGLFFVLNHEIDTEPACARCLGNSRGCDYCEINMRMRESEAEDISVIFMPMNKEYKGPALGSILECASKAGVIIDGNCGGRGTCRKCRVNVRKRDGSTEYVLSCLTAPEDGMTVTVPEVEDTVERKKKLLKLPDGFTPDTGEGLGAAVDIGTTTVVVMLWDLQNGEMLGTDAFTNPQGTRGADVISRIQYTIENEGGLEELNKSVIEGINESLSRISGKTGVSPDDIRKYVVVGNTTMSHLFLGIDPTSLAVSPFSPAFTGPVCIKAGELGLKPADAELKTVPNIAGHVGSDITAGILAADVMEDSRGHLFIDIGTNGEIVLSAGGVAATCSTAAGPAFEGSSIAYGMRAARGAIERIELTEQGIKTGVIGDTTPVGICGSGIIDAVGEMVKAGVVDKTGKLLSPEKLEKKGVSPEIIKNIIKENGGYSLVLGYNDEGKAITISQKDVREIQLAKAAIRAGWETLMISLGIKASDLERVSIAGAFGSFIRKESAVSCGLIPDIPPEKIFFVGNSAGIGASMSLLSREAFEDTVSISEEIKHIELATQPDFQDKYMMAMRF